MNIKDANNRIEEIDNKIEFLLNKKELEVSKVLPKATSFEKEKISKTRTEKYKFLHYVYEVEEIDKKIDILHKEKQILLEFVESELKRLKKYNDIEQLIIYYKEYSDLKYTWWQIANEVGYSQTQCRRIYRNYKQTRDI